MARHDRATREVEFNARLRAFAKHWGFRPHACAPYRARTKGKGERGVGYALIERALAEAKAKGHRLVVLVGDEPYYGKSGFKRIPKGRASMPGPVDPARLLVCELGAGAFDGVSGPIRPDWNAA